MPTIPNGAESEVTFISGITNTAKIAGTAFGTWKFNSPATYSATTSNEVKWGSTTLSTSGASGGVVTYWFDTASHWTSTEQNAFTAGLALWSAEANITFAPAVNAASANQTFFRDVAGSKTAYQTYTSAISSTIGSGIDGHAVQSKIVIDTSQSFWHIGTSFDDAGGYGWQTLVHEEGHMLGLGHGGPYNGNVTSSAQQFSTYDTRLWSLMSYIDPTDTHAKFYGSSPVTGTNWAINSQGYGYEATTPMILDILAIQRIYGPATSGPLASGGQTFGFHSNIAGQAGQFFDFNVNQHPVVTIWDGGTGNTLDLSGFSAKSTINLNPGTFSSANGMVNNIAIATDTTVETAIGGSGNDTITGNAADNIIRGNGGNDTIDGGAGIDTAIFSGTRSQYTLTALSGNGARVSGPDGIDTLTNIERLRFDDQTVTWPTGGSTVTDDFANSLTDASHPLGQVAVGGSATGSLEVVGDRDWFAVQLTAGTSYTISETGAHGGLGTLSDPYLRVHNGAGAVVAENDDIVTNVNPDSQLTYTPTVTGTFYVEASAFSDSSKGTYRIAVSGPAASGDDYANSLTDQSHPLGALTVGGASTGKLEVTADRDWYQVSLTAGTTYTVNLTGQQGGGGTLEDPYVRVHSSIGVIVAENDDIVAGVNRDSQLTFSPTTTGTYYVEAGAYNDNYTGTYTVRLGLPTVADDFASTFTDTTHPFGQISSGLSKTGNLEVAGDRDWFAVQFAAGATYTINLTGSQGHGGTLSDPYVYLHNDSGALLAQNDDIVDGVNVDSRLIFSATSSGTYYIEAGSYQDSFAGTYAVSVTGAATRDDFANSLSDTAHSLGAVTVNRSTAGNLESLGDRDWFGVQLTAGTPYTFKLDGLANNGGSLEDSYLWLHNSAGAVLAENDDIVDGVIRDSLLSFTPTSTGTYYLEAGAFQDSYTGTYKVSAAVTDHPTTTTQGTYNAPSKNYTVTVTAGSSLITVQDKVGTGGTDTLTNVQTLQFTDQTIDTSLFTKTASLTAPQLIELVDIYVAYFNRAPDALGLDFWGGSLKDGTSFATIANGFSGSVEAVTAYPATLSNQAFVTAVYTNVLGRNTDATGLSFWSNQLQSGAVSKGSFILSVIESVLLQSGTADAQYIGNKETVGAHFALAQGLSDGAWAKTVMSGVNGTTASVTSANAQTDAFAATAATAAGTEFVVKILGIVT